MADEPDGGIVDPPPPGGGPAIEPPPPGGAPAIERAAERVWSKRLKTFSGRRPTPSSENDHESWDLYATQLLGDVDVPAQTKRQLLFQSFAQPALGVVRSLGRDAALDQIVELIRISYGTTADGHTLLLKFYNTLQETDELSSHYLQRLQIKLQKVIEAEGTTEDGSFALLVGQFCRGAKDEDMIRDLGLKARPIGFAGFCALLVRMKQEELHRKEKVELLEKKDTATRTLKKTARNSIMTTSKPDDVVTEMRKAMDDLALKMEAKIDARLAQVTTKAAPGEAKQKRTLTQQKLKDESGRHTQGGESSFRRVKRNFCFKCGLEGHFRYNCENSPNSELVYQKLNAEPGKQGN